MTTSDHEVLRCSRGGETRTYNLRVAPGGAELWRVTESDASGTSAIKECEFASSEETSRFLESGRVTQITDGKWLDTNPLWMPDNRTLLFVSSRGGGRDIYTIGLTAGGQPAHEPQRLTSGVKSDIWTMELLRK